MISARGLLPLFLLSILVAPLNLFSQPIGKIFFKGNFHIPSARIREQMSTQEDHWWSHHRFDQRTLLVDLVKIAAFYHQSGFLTTKVRADTSRDKEGKLDLSITIQEGVQTLIGEVEFSGLTHLPAAKVSRVVATKVGGPLSPKGLDEDKKRITSLYADNGYPYARVDPSYQLSRDSTSARVLFQIKEGTLVRYGKIKIRGLRSAREDLVRRELTIKPGQVYCHSQIEESQQRVYSTGLFNYVRIYAQNPFERPGEPDFIVSVMERENRWFGLRTGLGQDEQYDVTLDLTGEWGDRNIGGAGRKLTLSTTLRFQAFGRWTNLKNRFAATYTEPWFLHTRSPFSLRLYFDPGVREKILGYRVQKFGGDLDLSHEVRKNFIVRADYSYEAVDIFGVSPSRAEEIRREKGITIRRKIGLSATNDTRDNVFIPHQGSWTHLSLSFYGGPLGGDRNFYRVIGSWSRYQRLTRGLILANRLKLGFSRPFGSTKEVPSTDWFYVGGGSSIRGYVERSIGPKDTLGYAVERRVLLCSNIELRFPLFWRLGGSIFMDGGGVWQDRTSISLKKANLSIGCGMQVFTPVGPLRLDYGQRIFSEEIGPGGKFHFSVLYCF